MKYLRTKYIKIIFLEMRKHKCYFALAIALMLLASLIPVLETHFFQQMIENIQTGEITRKTVFFFIIYIILRLLLPRLLRDIQNIINKNNNYIIDTAISLAVYNKICSMPIPVLENGKEINLATRLMSIRSVQGGNFISGFVSLLIEIVSLILMVINYGFLGLILFAMSMVFMLFSFRMNNKINDQDYSLSRAYEEEKRQLSSIKQLLMNKKNCLELFSYDTRALYAQKLYENTENINKKEFRKSVKIEANRGILFIYQTLCLMFLYAIVIIMMLLHAITGSMAVTVISVSAQRIFSMVERCVYYISNIKHQRHYIEEFEELMNFSANHTISTEKNQTLRKIDLIKFDNVSYKYMNNSQVVLDHVNFSINSGEKIAIVGDNGAGKSTLIRLLLGLDAPSEGRICISPDDEEYRAVIWNSTSVMLQNFYKYSYSIKENIVISQLAEKENTEKLHEVASWSQADTFIKRLEDQYDTHLIDCGYLSGGEWQKIALSRAKFKPAELYVLDEPNAAVDPKYEIELIGKLFKMIGNKTAFIVSHRLPICQMCDKILVMRQGRVVEFNSHLELLKNKEGFYYKLYQKQSELYK